MSLRNTGLSDLNSCLFYIGKRNAFHYILSANKHLWRFSIRIYVTMGIKSTKYYLFSLSHTSLPRTPLLKLFIMTYVGHGAGTRGHSLNISARKVLP